MEELFAEYWVIVKHKELVLTEDDADRGVINIGVCRSSGLCKYKKNVTPFIS